MYVLNAADKSYELVLTAAATTTELPWTAHWVDVLTVDQTVFALGESDGVTAGTGAVTVVPAPSTGHTRTLKSFSLYNADSTGATATFRLKTATTTRIIVKPLLSIGDTLEYTE